MYKSPRKHEGGKVKSRPQISKSNVGRNFEEDIAITSVEVYQGKNVTKNKHRATL